MSHRLALLVLIVFLGAGCFKQRMRGPGPFNKTPPTPNPTLLQGTAPAAKSVLAIDSPANPQPPAPPDQVAIVPSKVPEPAPVGPIAKSLPPVTVPDSPVAVNPPATPPRQPVAAIPAPTTDGLAALKTIARTAADRWKGIDTFEARLVRRESVGTKTPQTEEVQFQFRKEPFSVYMRNVGAAGRGREVLYNPSKFDDKLHVIVGEGDTKFIRAGNKAPSMSPDSPRVRAESRHSIREVGFGTAIGSFAKTLSLVESGKAPPETLKYTGRVKRKGLGDGTLDAVEQTIHAGEETQLPAGGVRQWYFDADPKSPAHGLPVLVMTFEGGREVEYYCFTAVRAPANLTDADFDPARLGKSK